MHAAPMGPGTAPRAYDACSVNHYEALGIPVDTDATALRRAYLAAARRHHPDYHAAADDRTRTYHARQMQLANEAWAVLGNVAARERYDLTLRKTADPPTERVRPLRDPPVPPGKGWTPRRADTEWQDDFRSWADHDERLAPDEPGDRPNRGLVAVVPVALFGLSVVAVFIGLVLTSRPLIAGGFVLGVVSAALFVLLPILEMSRGRHQA